MSSSTDKLREHNKLHQRSKRPTNCNSFFISFSCLFFVCLTFKNSSQNHTYEAVCVCCITIHFPWTTSKGLTETANSSHMQCSGWTFQVNIVCIVANNSKATVKMKTSFHKWLWCCGIQLGEVREHKALLNYRQAEAFCKIYCLYYYLWIFHTIRNV